MKERLSNECYDKDDSTVPNRRNFLFMEEFAKCVISYRFRQRSPFASRSKVVLHKTHTSKITVKLHFRLDSLKTDRFMKK